MLTEEQVAEMQACAAETIKCENCSRYDVVDCLGSVRRALLADRAELEAEIERLRVVAEAARHAFNMRPAHYATYRLSYDVVEQPGLYWHASRLAPAMDTLGCALAALEGEA